MNTNFKCHIFIQEKISKNYYKTIFNNKLKSQNTCQNIHRGRREQLIATCKRTAIRWIKSQSYFLSVLSVDAPQRLLSTRAHQL